VKLDHPHRPFIRTVLEDKARFLGDGVNTAARPRARQGGEILTSGRDRERIARTRTARNLRDLDAIQVKGKHEAVRVFALFELMWGRLRGRDPVRRGSPSSARVGSQAHPRGRRANH